MIFIGRELISEAFLEENTAGNSSLPYLIEGRLILQRPLRETIAATSNFLFAH